MRKLCRFLLVFILLLCTCVSANAASITIQSDHVASFQDNLLDISVPKAGHLDLTIRDQYNIHKKIADEVEAGAFTIHWDGLTDHQEKLIAGEYLIQAELTTEYGEKIFSEYHFDVGKAKQALLFAMPSSNELYLGGGEDWFIELCTVRAGIVIVDVYYNEHRDIPIVTFQYNASDGEPFKHTWDGRVKGKELDAGEYWMTLYAKDNPQYAHSFKVELIGTSAPIEEIMITGDVMPAINATDAEIWALMQKPSVICDIKNTSHQKVYAFPDVKSAVLGTLHGQSQCVEILSVDDSWALIKAWNHEEGAPVQGYVPKNVLKVVQPSPTYGLLIDKKTQRMTIYQEGTRLETIPISTGLVARNKLIRETAAGSFVTVEHIESFTSGGYHYQYVIRYDGGNLIHQIGFKKKNGQYDYSEQTATLGQKGSHGCIRIPHMPANENEVCAYWLWTHLPYHTRVIIMDDPDARLSQAAAVKDGRQPDTAIYTEYSNEVVEISTVQNRTVELTALPSAPEIQENETELIITYGGDTVLGTREAWWSKAEALPTYLKTNGIGYPFEKLLAVFSQDDLTIVNLECVLKSNREGERTDKKYRFRGLPSWAKALSEGNIELVNIANNHYIDYQASGKKATRDSLTAAGIHYSGYGFQYILEKNGYKIGFAGMRETIYSQDPSALSKEIKTMKANGCDVIIYSFHWGEEYSPRHNELQTQLAREAIDAGADIIIGTHPHVVQGVDMISGKPVLWSLGNLMFGGTIDLTTFDATLAQLRLRFDETGYLGCAITMIPVLTSGRAQERINDYRPVLAEGADKDRIIRKIQDDTSFAVTQMMWFPASYTENSGIEY